jgi:hypothetical protein
MRAIRHLSKSEAAVFVGLFAALLTLIDLVSKYPLVYKIGTAFVTATAVGWLLYELWPRDPHSVSRSGLQAFRQNFDIEQTREILDQAETRFCYYGVSFQSAWSLFKNWYLSPDRKNVRSIRILLADPELPEVLAFSASWEGKGSRQEAPELIRQRIVQTVREIQELNAPCIEVRFHRENCREWIYVVDQTVYVGLVEKGSERHHNPALVLSGRTSGEPCWNLHSHYLQEWDTLWASARKPETPASARTSEPQNAAELRSLLATKPDPSRRISLLATLSRFPLAEQIAMLDLVLSTDFLEHELDEVREAGARWLGELSPLITDAQFAQQKKKVEVQLFGRFREDPCRSVKISCANAFLKYFDGTRFARLADIVRFAENERVFEIAEDCVAKWEEYSSPESDRDLLDLAKRSGRDIQRFCLDRLKERRPLSLFNRVLNGIRKDEFRRDNMEAAVDLLFSIDARAALDVQLEPHVTRITRDLFNYRLSEQRLDSVSPAQ